MILPRVKMISPKIQPTNRINAIRNKSDLIVLKLLSCNNLNLFSEIKKILSIRHSQNPAVGKMVYS
jgi:hypothetical protein